MTTQTHTLSRFYTRMRPIGFMTANARNTLTATELLWIDEQWRAFRGGPEDGPYNVICDLTTPQSGTRVWVMDRDGPDSWPMLMLPEDY